jgi:NitT/TauT family transport system ATP-binding protein
VTANVIAARGATADTPPSGPGRQLVIDRLSVVYRSRRGDLPAVADITMDIAEGEFVAILGPSGCGKSTLLKIVSGLLKPTSGTVILDGTPVTRPRSDVGIVFQQATLLPWRTVLGNVLTPIRALRRSEAAHRDKAMELLRLVGLEAFAGHYPHELSGGMQQRVGLARSLIHDPRLLLMDEPFAALDAMTRDRMAMELQAIWSRTRKAVLFITHSIPEAVVLADRIIVLSERPARVVEVLEVGLPRPRGPDVVAQPEFASLCAHLRDCFHIGGER